MTNEKRLIDANALKDALRTNEGAKALGHSVHRLFCVDEIIDKAPTVDAVEVVHGRWERKSWWQHKNHYEMGKCSVCGHQVKPKDAHNYCPDCGAKMDGGNEDG